MRAPRPKSATAGPVAKTGKPDKPAKPKPVDDAFGYDTAYVEAVGILPLTSRLLRNQRNIWQLSAIGFFILFGLQLVVHWVSGDLAHAPHGGTVMDWIIYFQFDLLHAFLISYMALGSESFRRGFACHVRRLAPWLDPQAPTPEDILAARPSTGRIVGLIAIIVFVPIMSIPVYDVFPVKAIFYMMILRMTVLYWFVGTRLTEFVSLGFRFAALIRQHLTYRLIDDAPRQIVGSQTITSSMFMMIGVAVTIPTLFDAPTALQTIVVLGTVTLASLVILLVPVFALRERIKATKDAELAMLQPRLNACWDSLQKGENPPHDLPALVAWRQEIRNASEWVFDGETALRMLVILLVPAGSWLASELAETLVDRLIGG